MIVLVCGGRNFNDHPLLLRSLDRFHKEKGIEMVIHGDAQGADRMAGAWAMSNGIHYAAVPALWNVLGRTMAGPRRNAAMLLLRPEAVIAFPGGRGTEDMVKRAIEYGINVWRPTRASETQAPA